jgi:molecular chaperone HtpG
VKDGEHHAFFQQVLRSHGRSVPDAARTLELNGSHPLIVSLQAMVEKNGSDPKLSEWIELLYDQALLTEGSRVADPNRFAKSLTSLMQQAAAARTANP